MIVVSYYIQMEPRRLSRRSGYTTSWTMQDSISAREKVHSASYSMDIRSSFAHPHLKPSLGMSGNEILLHAFLAWTGATSPVIMLK